MEFVIENHVNEIIELVNRDNPEEHKRNGMLAHHLWLAGFNYVIEDCFPDKKYYLEECKIEGYMHEIAPKFLEFTKLQSSSFLVEELINQRKPYPIHLPISDSHHLLFYLTHENDFMLEFLYEFKECCKILAPYEFPHFELRISINLNETNEPIHYDNRVSIRKQKKELMMQGYNALEEFIENTKL